MKSPWEILGVERGTSVDELKKVYKKLALQYHPDRNPGDKEAEEKFKEITAAYEAISSGKADQPTGHGFGGFPDFSDLENFFTGGFSVKQDIRQAQVTLDFKEYCLGATKTITVDFPKTCTTCSGVGAKDGDYSVCATCNGRGSRTIKQGMMVISLGTCPACRGKGKSITTPCTDCSGHGEKEEPASVSVHIPPLSPSRVGLNLGKIQLHVSLNVTGQEGFEIDNRNIRTKYSIPLADALFGQNIDVNTIYGTKKVKVPPMDKGYTELRLRGLGAGSPCGDHIIEVMVALPESDEDRIKIKDLLDVDKK
jgi:molecular chaperone DnaJ